MTALGAVRIAAGYQCVTLLTLFSWWQLARSRLLLLGFDLVNRPVAFNIPAKIEHQTILFVGVQSEAATHALIQQAG